MLEWWLDAVFSCGKFERIFVNIHHCADQVENWLDTYFYRTGNIVKIIDERSGLLGTAGTLFWHGDSSDDFMVAYTDTFCESFYHFMPDCVDHFNSLPEELLSGLVSFAPENRRAAGMIKINSIGDVLSFEEKATSGDTAWAGIMFGRKKIFDILRPEDKDIAYHLMPKLIGRMRVISQVPEAYDIGRGIEYYADLDKRFRQATRN